MHNTTLIVFGGAGFIGSNFIQYVLSKYKKVHVVCVDVLTYAGNKDNLTGFDKNRFTFIKGDITNKALILRLLKKYRPTYAINFAAESHVDRSIHGGADVFAHTNVFGTTVLLDALKLSSISFKKYVQVSTDEVYGSLSLQSKKTFTEQSQLAPNSLYAASKAAADLIARSFYTTHKLPIVVTRCSNNYGPYQHPEKLIPFSVTRLLKGKPIAIYGDGKNVRDWIYVDDHCSALLLALIKGVPGEVYNVGADDEVSNLDIARRLIGLFKKDKSAMEFVKDRPGHDRRYAIDSSKIRRELGWKPVHSLRTSFDKTVAWYVEHQSWIKRALARAGKSNTHI